MQGEHTRTPESSVSISCKNISTWQEKTLVAQVLWKWANDPKVVLFKIMTELKIYIFLSTEGKCEK